jgi:pyruvate-ferredoxin/flavodoxin oxidoreductase
MLFLTNLAVKEMKKAIEKSYGTKGEHIVKMNNDAVDKGGEVNKIEIPKEWAKSVSPKQIAENLPDFVKNIMLPINALKKAMIFRLAHLLEEKMVNFPKEQLLTKNEVLPLTCPEWIGANCIQCNQCSYVCPHAAIRPFLLDEKEAAGTPANTELIQGIGGTKDLSVQNADLVH